MVSQKLVVAGNKDFPKNEEETKWYLLFCCLIANFIMVSAGFGISWQSPILPKLKSLDPSINPLSHPISTLESSIITSLPLIGSIIGVLSVFFVSDRIGRKKTLIIIAITFVVSFTTLSMAKNINLYFICLFVNGICESSSLCTVSIYITEIAEIRNRGRCGYMTTVIMPFGGLIVHIFGSFTSVQSLTLVGTAFPILFLIFSFFIPESPIFLARKLRNDESCKALEKLRRCKDVDVEFDMIKKMVITTKNKKNSTFLDIFRSRSNTKAFFISFNLWLVQQSTGVFILAIFMAPIFNESKSYISGNSFGIISGIIQILTASMSSLLIDRLGRRILLLFSCMSCSINLFILGVHFYLKEVNLIIKWLPILFVIIYYIGYTSGMGPLPIIVSSELFSNDLRAIGVSTVLFFNSFPLFAQLFSFPIVIEAIGLYFFLWIYAVGSFLGCFSLFFTIPETKGKSFEEIQNILSNGKNSFI